MKAGGTTAAVEGTAFVVMCVDDANKLTCTFTAVVDNIKVTAPDGSEAQLGPAKSVVVTQGNLGTINTLTYDDLANNIFIAGNLALDQQAGIGRGLLDLPPAPTPTTTGGTGGTGTGTAPTVAGGDTNAQITVTADPTVLAEQYPPVPGGLVVDNPNVQAGGEATFRGAGCVPNEVLQVLFDGKPIGTITVGQPGQLRRHRITIPRGTAPGVHILTVRGLGLRAQRQHHRPGRTLAFTGSSSHTTTYVLAGIAAVVVGFVLVVGTRRRRGACAAVASSPPPLGA